MDADRLKAAGGRVLTFFPEGNLSAVPAFHLWVRRRLLLAFILIGGLTPILLVLLSQVRTRALLDAEILADVYLAMTGGQVSLSLDAHVDSNGQQRDTIQRLAADRPPLAVIRADDAECEAHMSRLDAIDKACDGSSVWRRMEQDAAAT